MYEPNRRDDVWTINLYAESVSYGDWGSSATCLATEFIRGRWFTSGNIYHRPLVF